MQPEDDDANQRLMMETLYWWGVPRCSAARSIRTR